MDLPFIIHFDILVNAHPPQIVGVIVQCVAIYVVNRCVGIGIGIGTEGLRDQSADQTVLGLSVLAKSHPLIALVVNEGS